MNWRRVKGLATKELIHVGRDPRSLIMAVGIPMLMLALFGFALTLDVDKVPMVVLDWSKTPESRDLISRFEGSRFFNVLPREVSSYKQIESSIDHRDALISLVIPVDFASKIAVGAKTDVQLLLDGSDANTATLALGYVKGVVKKFSERKQKQVDLREGRRGIIDPLDLRQRIWFNPDLQSRINIVPNLIATIMMVISALLTSLCIAREWEKGTMEQLISTPVQKNELFIGKLFPYFMIGFVDVCLVMLMGEFIFEVPFRGSLLLLVIVSLIFLVGSLCLGMLISIIAKSQLLATQLAVVTTFLPSFLLSGFITPIENMPYPIQLISYAVPARYFISILRDIYLKGEGIMTLYQEISFLMCFTLLMIGLSLAKFKKKLEG